VTAFAEFVYVTINLSNVSVVWTSEFFKKFAYFLMLTLLHPG